MNIASFGIGSVAAITVICYVVGMIVHNSTVDNKWIPTIVGLAGGVLGGVGFICGMPDFPAQDVITAIAVGIASGLAATGADQLVKIFEKE